VTFDGREIAAVFAGGALGALARAGLTEAADTPPGHWPWATFAANIAGAFLLGYFATRLQERLPLTRYRRPFLGTGFCGALTTFSTWMVDTDRLLAAGHDAEAAGDLFGSLAAGLAATSLGLTIGRAIVAHRNRVRGGDRDRDRELAVDAA
jgi:CrcB protein